MFGLSKEEVQEIVRDEIQKAWLSHCDIFDSTLKMKSDEMKAEYTASFDKWSSSAVKNINSSIDGKITATRKSLENDISMTRTAMKEQLSQATELLRCNATNHVELQTDVVEITRNLAQLEEARNQSMSTILTKLSELHTSQQAVMSAVGQALQAMKKQSDLCVRLLEKSNQTSEEILKMLAPRIEIKNTDLSLKLTKASTKKAKNGNKL